MAEWEASPFSGPMLTETAVTGEFVVAFQVVPLGTDISVIAFPTINDAEDAIEKLKGVDINGQPVSLSLAPVSLSCPSARQGLIVRMRDLRPLSPDDLLLETLEDLDTTIDEATTTDEVVTMTADRGMMIVTTTDRGMTIVDGMIVDTTTGPGTMTDEGTIGTWTGEMTVAVETTTDEMTVERTDGMTVMTTDERAAVGMSESEAHLLGRGPTPAKTPTVDFKRCIAGVKSRNLQLLGTWKNSSRSGSPKEHNEGAVNLVLLGARLSS